MCSHCTPVASIRKPHKHAEVGDEALPQREAVTARWRLIPHWSRDEPFSARSEAVADKPSFRDAWSKGQRCIILAMSVFEPDWRSGQYVPAEISRSDDMPVCISTLKRTKLTDVGGIFEMTI
jgi:putative SOS response-associated peptidase YedK